jgi:NADH-quinone oxidoreductase subunit J
MIFEIILFYFFSSFILLSAIMVITADNAIYSVLFLILTFCNSTLLLLLLNAEFLAFTIILVYIGAVAVLFLFVVMMLDIKQITKYDKNIFFLIPSNLIIGIIIFVEIYLILFKDLTFNLNPTLGIDNLIYINWFDLINSMSNIEMIGQIMYTYYFIYLFQAGLILLLAMIGAIVLTMSTNSNSRRQHISEQISRNVKYSYFTIIEENNEEKIIS